MPDTLFLKPLDWAVLGIYLLALAVSGFAFARREQKDTGDYFLGGRRMPVWAVALSIIASSLSVATFIGVPQIAYETNITYLLTNLGGLIAVMIVAVWFIPAFYRANVTSIYELLGQRLGEGAKKAASATFMLGRVFASGARIYIAAIPLSMLLFGDSGVEQPEWQIVVACLALTAISVSYTLTGGISSVIWTEVVQTVVLLVAVCGAIWLLLHKIPMSGAQIVETLRSPSDGSGSKLLLVDTRTSPAIHFTLWTSLIAFPLMGLASYGTDHDLAQRMLTCKTAIKGGQSAVLAILLGIPIVALFMVIGLLLYVFYGEPTRMGSAAPAYAPPTSTKVFLTFILREMPAGMSGLMMAGLLSVGISSLNSALNAMSATAIKDFYMPRNPGRPPRHYVTAGRIGVAAWGVILAAFAVFCVYWQRTNSQTLIDLALGVMTFAYAGLLAVFLAALFTKRGNSTSAVAAILVGFCVLAALQPIAWNRYAWAIGLKGVKLSWPWHLVIGTVLSLLVCVAGRRPEKTVD
ncbi:MAG: sodium:solute symporter [Phycisphaeraceae bacterium]|nr:sodium:solute symporter [Phycisphaeraceae bacterium]